MANFNTPVQPENAPNYINEQRGTDRAQLQGLATVPNINTKYVQPDYAADKSLGTGLKDLGTLADAGIKLTDQVITQKVNDTVQAGLDNIRGGFITAQAEALGQNPANGKSLVDDADGNKSLPGPVAGVEDRLKNMQAAYKQGVFDDTAYYGKLDAYVSQMKTMFPGYTDVVDEKVKSVIGTTPANALRSAQRQQLDELNKKLESAANKQETREHEDAKYIADIWPNYFADKAAGRPIPDWGTVQSKVAQRKAVDYSTESKKAALSADNAVLDAKGRTAETLATQELTEYASRMYVATTNSMNLHSMADFQALTNAVTSGKRDPLTPDEKAQVSQAMAQMIQAYNGQAEKIMTKPLAQGDPNTYTSYINNPQKRAAIIDQGRTALKNMEDTLTNDKFGLFQYDAQWHKAVQDSEIVSILRTDKSFRTVQGSRAILGDQGVAVLMTQVPALKTALEEGYRKLGVGALLQPGPENSLSDVYNMMRQNGQMSPDVWKAVPADAVNAIINREKLADPTAAKTAVQNLFGPKNTTIIDAWKTNPGSMTVFFSGLVSNRMTESIKHMDADSQKTYYNFANSSFESVYRATANEVNNNTQAWKASANLSLKFDPNTNNFAYEKTSGMSGFLRGGAPEGTVQKANSELLPLNKAIETMKPVWAAEGRKTNDEVFRLLPMVGIYPHTPLYEAVHKQMETDVPRNENRYAK